MGKDILFELIHGAHDNPLGFVTSYIPIISETNSSYRFLFGYSVANASRESARLYPIRDLIKEGGQCGYVHLTESYNDLSIIKHLQNIGGWDIFRSTKILEPALAECALLVFLYSYMEDFKVISNRIPNPTEENMADLLNLLKRDNMNN